MIECWKPVLGYEDLYQVSDTGRVRRIAGGCGARVGRILRACNASAGYPCICLRWNGHKKTQTVHTLVAQAFLGPRPVGLQVNHKNGIKTDNRVVNLEYVTQSENIRHSFRVLGRKGSGGGLHGVANGRAKLTAPIVREIRRRYTKDGVTQCELAKQYGVSQSAISRILHRKKWAHVA